MGIGRGEDGEGERMGMGRGWGEEGRGGVRRRGAGRGGITVRTVIKSSNHVQLECTEHEPHTTGLKV